MKAIILGSDRGIRRLDSARSYPTALLEDRRGKRALDWTLSALADAGIDDGGTGRHRGVEPTQPATAPLDVRQVEHRARAT